jgi:acetyltransferase-like isoleucine patch superfamily enzyme
MADKIHPTVQKRGSTISQSAEVREYCSLHEVELADDVVILERVSIRRSTLARDAFVNAGSVIENATIEEDVQIAPNCSIMGVWHEFDERHVSDEDVFSRITLKKNCLLGAGVIVTPGVTIGEGAVVGAGTIVTKDIPANHICYGIPPQQTCMPIEKYLHKKKH